ncbi:MAG TPA: hypothetical protein VH590_03005 [Ktedonobacterales bacterium]|jgi:hypothetical protein
MLSTIHLWRRAGKSALALGLLLLVGSLAACSSGSSTASGPTPTTTPERCGSVTIGPANLAVNDTANQAENCFWQAFGTCKPASLVVTWMGTDAGVVRTFLTRPSGSACAVIDQAQTYVAPSHKGPLQSYTCAGLVQRQGGLLFQSCGNDGDLMVPRLSIDAASSGIELLRSLLA